MTHTGDWTQTELVLRPWPSLDDRRVLATGRVYGVAWGPDGELIYSDERDYPGDSRIMSLRVDTAGLPLDEATELFRGPVGGAGPMRAWDVTADGQRILGLPPADDDTHPGDPSSPVIHVVLNWFTELRARR
jgi:hypothetical protein